jgi:tetratricopeptide (TPR) repeat protein
MYCGNTGYRPGRRIMKDVVRLSCLVSTLAIAGSAWADATLRGVVVHDREHGAPIAGVTVSSVGANLVTTGVDGQFVLVYRGRRPGQDVTVQVSYAGCDVVNYVLLDRQLPDLTSTRAFEIILCERPICEQRKIEFYRLKGNQAVDQTYREKLARLAGSHAATAAERDQLRRERDSAFKQVDEWAHQIAARTPAEVDGTYRDALRLFVDGKADAALRLLSDDWLQREVDQAQQQLTQAQDKLKQAVDGWLLKGQILSGKFDYEGAARTYDRAVAAAPASMDAWWAYAYFHHQQNHFRPARQGWERMLALARQASDNVRVAAALNSLGNLSSDENRKAEARKLYEETLVLYRALAAQNPEVYWPEVARTLNNLANLSSDENRKADARKLYEETLAIYRALAAQKSEVYRPDVARTLNNLANLSSDENRNAEARKLYEEALTILRELAAENPGIYRCDVAVTLNNLGELSRAENRKPEARKLYKEALAIYRALSAQNPDVYRPYIAVTLNNLGELSRAENLKIEARKLYQEALAIYRALAAQNPDVYRPNIAVTLNNLGELSRDENRRPEARKLYHEALTILREIATQNPDVYRPYVAVTLNNLGELSRDENRDIEARKLYEEALAIYREFAMREPATYRAYVRTVEENLRGLSRRTP